MSKKISEKRRRKTTKEKNKLLKQESKQLKHYGLQLRIYPSEIQSNFFERSFGCTRFVYNDYLAERKSYYKETGKTLSVNKYKKEYLVVKKQTEEYSFLKEIDKFALEFACECVEDAYTRFFKGQNRYPQFKTKKKSKKSYTTKFTNDNIKIVDKNNIKLPKAGLVKIAKLKTERNKDILMKLISCEARILKATVSKKGKKYYVSLTLEEVIPLVVKVNIKDVQPSEIVGIDLGLKTFATLNNGVTTEFRLKENYIKASEKKLAKYQRRLSRKEKDSSNFIKAAEKVAKLQEHIANQRKDFSHKLSRQIVNENQIVIMETLNIKGMVKNKKLSKSISDAGWYQFISFIKYKLEAEGKHFVQVDRWFASSKLCSNCDEKHIGLSLNEREWLCSCCGSIHERDENAAINIRNEGIRLLESQIA